MLSQTLGDENNIGELVWHNVTDNNPTRVACEHEYIECYAKTIQHVAAEWKSPISDAKNALIRIGQELIERHGETEALKAAYQEWHRENKRFLGQMDRYKYIDGGGVYTGSQSVHNPGKEGYRYDVLHPVTRKPCKQPLMGYRFPEETMNRLLAEDRIIFGDDENKIVELKVYAHEYEDKLSSVITLDGRSGANDLRAMFPGEQRFKNPKASTLLESIFPFVADDGDIVFDFFAGSGTTAQAVLALNRKDKKRRRFMLSEMGSYFDSITKPRISKIMFSPRWNAGAPEAPGDWQGLVKVQRLEQYEDVLANLNAVWDDAALPEGVPVSYLFRPEQNRLQLSLNLKRPFDNRLRIGKTLEERPLDLLESWAYLQGYWQRSRQVFVEAGRRYECLETECGTLVILRDIVEPEDDSAAIAAIAARYAVGDEAARLRRVEVNHWANLVSLEMVLNGLPCTIIHAHDFDRGAEWV